MEGPFGTRAVVVYESMFGNTEAVARAVGAGLRHGFDHVDVVTATDAPTSLDGVDLVVVGGPTHAFGMARPHTRIAAREQGADAAAERGVREWLQDLERPTNRIAAACFDTRIRKPLLPGSAARGIRRRLRARGLDVVDLLRCSVEGTPGPLAAGELARAERFGMTLARRAGADAAVA